MNIFFHEKSHPFDLLSVRKKIPACTRHMRNMGNDAEHIMFFKWRSKILACLCIKKKKKMGVKNKDTILSTNQFDLR